MTPVGNETVDRAQRAVASASALFREGLVPECHEYMLKALSELMQAWTPAPVEGDAEQPSATEQALRALEQARYRRSDRLRAALVAAQTSTAGAAGFPGNVDWLWAEIERLNAFTVRHFKTPAARKRQYLKLRIAAALALLVSLVFAQRLWGRTHAQASTGFSDEHLAKHAIDGL